MPDGNKKITDAAVVIKGAGEMASGVAHRLYRAGVKRIVMLEVEKPLCVRRFVSFCEAVHDGTADVENVRARLADGVSDLASIWQAGEIAVIVDPEWKTIMNLSPDIVIDAIMAKRNLGTRRNEAAFVVGIGPDFVAPRDVHAVIESNRGHDLGRVIYDGSAEPYTGMPGEIKGIAKERVLRAPNAGQVKHVHRLGDDVRKGDLVLYVDDVPVYAPFDGILRGLIREMIVDKGEKVGDVDPRAKKDYCFTISEKARGIAGGVLEAVFHHYFGQNGR
ncbi:MAG: selenium-dependent molybdenum hydroxylase system protein, YqeB family [Deltaproteobacteria bacterium]|nr:selenium-dependent molybdenum hydroxylase system protein, YqeB family [Deltaproteobacteria bacterium]